MEKTIVEFLDAVRLFGGLPVVSDREIQIGRVSLHVLPAVEADPPDRLFMEVPEDLRPDEALAPMALKAALIQGDLREFLDRMNASLRAGKEHRENSGNWQVRCSEKGSILSIEARYRA